VLPYQVQHKQVTSLFQEMLCLRGIAFGYESVRLKFRRAEKVARFNWRSNLPRDLTLIHGRGREATQVEVEGERANTRPHEKGFP